MAKHYQAVSLRSKTAHQEGCVELDDVLMLEARVDPDLAVQLYTLEVTLVSQAVHFQHYILPSRAAPAAMQACVSYSHITDPP
jgi:hypothetical protein